MNTTKLIIEVPTTYDRYKAYPHMFGGPFEEFEGQPMEIEVEIFYSISEYNPENPRVTVHSIKEVFSDKGVVFINRSFQLNQKVELELTERYCNGDL